MSTTNELADSRLFQLELTPRRLVINSGNKCGMSFSKGIWVVTYLVKIINDDYIIRVMRTLRVRSSYMMEYQAVSLS